jgi:hypothetical protein
MKKLDQKEEVDVFALARELNEYREVAFSEYQPDGESTGNEFSLELNRQVPVQANGKPVIMEKLDVGSVDVGNRLMPGDVYILEMDKIPVELKELAQSEEHLECGVNIATVILLKDRLGEGIRKRYGEKAYEKWRQSSDSAARLDAACKARNAKWSAMQNRVSTKGPEGIKLTIQEPGKEALTFFLTHNKLNRWERFRNWFSSIKVVAKIDDWLDSKVAP